MQITVDEFFACPPDRVFAAATDVDGWPAFIDGIDAVERLTDGPVGEGTRFRETRTLFGKSTTEEMTFASFKPGSSYELTGESCGCAFSTVCSLIPEGNGTRLQMVMTSSPQTFTARILGPIMGLMTKGMMVKCLKGDLESMKKHLEGGDQDPAAAPA